MKPSIPITHSVHLHKSYENKNLLLHVIYYETYSSKTCGDLKLIEMLIGMQPGFKEQYCFLRRCDSWATDENYIKSSWPPRALYQLGLCSINTPLVDSRNVLLPPLHILLGLMKHFIETFGRRNSRGVQYIKEKFPKITYAKLKESIFVRPQIREVLKDVNFKSTLDELELPEWSFFHWVSQNVLDNKKAIDYKDDIKNLLKAYAIMDCCILLKVHFLNSHLDFFL